MLIEAIGTAVALSVKEGKHIRDIDIGKVQQTLLYDDSYIPGVRRIVSELTKNAKTAEKYEVLNNGEDRPQGENANCASVKCGEDIVFSFDKFEDISEMRIIFDSNLNRPRYNMPCMFKLHEEHYKVPKTLVKSYRITAHTEDGDKVIYETARNRQRMNKIPAGIRADSITITPLETWGNEEVNIFSVDFI